MVAFGILLGIFVGISLSIFVMGLLVNKSNNKGDSKAKFTDFNGNFTLLAEKDKISKRENLIDARKYDENPG